MSHLVLPCGLTDVGAARRLAAAANRLRDLADRLGRATLPARMDAVGWTVIAVGIALDRRGGLMYTGRPASWLSRHFPAKVPGDVSAAPPGPAGERQQ